MRRAHVRTAEAEVICYPAPTISRLYCFPRTRRFGPLLSSSGSDRNCCLWAACKLARPRQRHSTALGSRYDAVVIALHLYAISPSPPALVLNDAGN